MRNGFRTGYATSLEPLIGRELSRSDGFSQSEIAACEKRLKLRLPEAVRDYYRVAGKLAINTEHNRLYAPNKLKKVKGKLVFMEENQRVVYWGIDMGRSADSEVFQANNEEPLQWYPEGCRFSKFIFRMLRWQRGLDYPL